MKDITENNKIVSLNDVEEIRRKCNCTGKCRCLGKGWYKGVASVATSARMYGRSFERNWAW